MADSVPAQGNKESRSSGSREARDFLLYLIQIQTFLGDSGYEDIAAAIGDAKPVDALKDPGFIADHPELASIKNEEEAVRVLSGSRYARDAARAAINIRLERFAEAAVARDMKYQMGAKGMNKSDCSGFVMNAFGKAAGERFRKTLFTTSEEQIRVVKEETGFVLKGRNLEAGAFREGMMIGIDSGSRGFDGERKMGIDHIGFVYRNSEDGRLMFAECRSRAGATIRPLDEVLERFKSKGWNLFAVDPMQMQEISPAAGQTASVREKKMMFTESGREVAGVQPSALPQGVTADPKVQLPVTSS